MGRVMQTADFGDTLSVEIFAAKDSLRVMMMVPCKCGLRRADSLRIKGMKMEVTCYGEVLPIALPTLSVASRDKLAVMAKNCFQLPVAEFMVGGLFDSYFLNLVVE